MRKVIARIYQADPESPRFSRIARSADVMNIQDFLHERLDRALRDFAVLGSPTPQVGGFGHALPGGLNFEVAEGHAVNAAGRSFSTFPAGAATVLAVGAAHPTQPRVDLVYAVLAEDQDADNQLLPHRRLRTDLEYQQNVPEYDPANINVPYERRNVAAVGIRAGNPGANPVAPAAGPNEVALYHVRVPAAAAALAANDVTDVRPRLRSNYQLNLDLAAILASPALADFAESIDDRVAALLIDTSSVVKAYDDASGTLTLSVPPEYIQDVVGALLAVVANTGLSMVYDDAANVLTLAGVAATGGAMGMMSAADKAKQDLDTTRQATYGPTNVTAAVALLTLLASTVGNGMYRVAWHYHNTANGDATITPRITWTDISGFQHTDNLAVIAAVSGALAQGQYILVSSGGPISLDILYSGTNGAGYFTLKIERIF